MIDQWWFLLLLGLAVGTFGTLIGAGGGFVLVPILLLLMPKTDPAQITAISLAVVFCNATSGSLAYLKMGRVDLKSAMWFALATLPGAVIGAITTKLIPRLQFNIVFGVLLVLVSIYLVFKPAPKSEKKEPSARHTNRAFVDAEGTEHEYSFSMALGLGLSVIVGFLSSLLGIGGGIIHVPILNRTLNFPVHIATATSHAILSIMALAGSLVHLREGTLDGHLGMVGLLGFGAIVGAQIGARLSTKLKGSGIIQALAVALGLVGIRLLWKALT
jgi:uncharacterized protein